MEVQANELRLGNWLTNFVGTDFKVNQIPISGMFPHPKPIPLTEEWLLKFGFEKTKHTGYYDKKWLSGDFFFDGKKLLVITEGLIDGDFIDIKFVHQLQNLYFCLTGEELTI